MYWAIGKVKKTGLVLIIWSIKCLLVYKTLMLAPYNQIAKRHEKVSNMLADPPSSLPLSEKVACPIHPQGMGWGEEVCRHLYFVLKIKIQSWPWWEELVCGLLEAEVDTVTSNQTTPHPHFRWMLLCSQAILNIDLLDLYKKKGWLQLPSVFFLSVDLFIHLGVEMFIQGGGSGGPDLSPVDSIRPARSFGLILPRQPQAGL